jgi:hypothetical protein
MQTIKYSAYPLGKLVCSRQPIGFDDFAPGVNPLRLDRIEPRTLLGRYTRFGLAEHVLGGMVGSAPLQHEVDQIRALGAQTGGELPVELLHRRGVFRLHAHAAGEADPVECRPVELHHI